MLLATGPGLRGCTRVSQRVERRSVAQLCTSRWRPHKGIQLRASSSTSGPTELESNPVRTAVGGFATNMFKLAAAFQSKDPNLSQLWNAIKSLDQAAVQQALQAGGNPNETLPTGDTPLLFIAREGHYKYPPAEIPTQLIRAGADLEAKDRGGLTALQVSLLSGWQNIAELLLQNKADTSGVASIKPRLTCPDCKRLVSKYQL